jgi:hypothetical protein
MVTVVEPGAMVTVDCLCGDGTAGSVEYTAPAPPPPPSRSESEPPPPPPPPPRIRYSAFVIGAPEVLLNVPEEVKVWIVLVGVKLINPPVAFADA